MRHVMKRSFLLALVLAVGGAAAGSAHAGILAYSGDFNGQRFRAQQWTSDASYSLTYGAFNVTGSGWNVTSVMSNDLINIDALAAPPMAHWEIRSGVSAGSGGTLIAGGDSSATFTPTGRSLFGLIPEYSVEVTGLNLQLAPGTYWLSVAPIGTSAVFSLNTETNGENAVGTAFSNAGDSFVSSSPGGPNFASAGAEEFSMGLGGSLIPEPASVVLCGIGTVGLLVYGWRRRSPTARR